MALLLDIGAGPEEGGATITDPITPGVYMNNPAYLQAFNRSFDISGIYQEDVGEPPNWLNSVLSTGLEGFRVREARRAMKNRPLTPDEASIFTRGQNLNSLSPNGSSMALIAVAAIVAVIFLRR